MFHCPTPKELLEMQFQGTRCVTAFVEPEQLIQTYTDHYPPHEGERHS
jgi:hypothetical protein